MCACPLLKVRIHPSYCKLSQLTSIGHRRAFVQFESTDVAISFIREHFPKLHLELPAPTDEVPDGRFNVPIHFARSREDADTRGASNTNWDCPTVCPFTCSIPDETDF